MAGWSQSSGWNQDVTEDKSIVWSRDQAGNWESSSHDDCPWRQSAATSKSPTADRPYHREAGNGNRPKAHDPSGWTHGENKPTELEYTEMIECGNYGPRKTLKLKFKAYAHRESQKMGVEDRLSGMVGVLEREKALNEATAAEHDMMMKQQIESMEAAHEDIMNEAMAKMRGQAVRTVEVEVEVIKEVEVEVEVIKEVVVLQKVFIEVDVLPDGVERPPPLFRGGQSIHQWWASWMSGAHETPAGIKGKTGRPAWYSANVYS